MLADRSSEARLRALLETGIALTSELSIDSLLQTLVEAAASLTGARYAALGVIDEAGTGLERFVTTGIDPQTHAAIGDLPRGRAGPSERPRKRSAAFPQGNPAGRGCRRRGPG